MRRLIKTFTFLLLSGLAWSACAQKNTGIDISLVMPFCSGDILDNPSHTNAELGNIAREYYQGALIAMDSFERAGVDIRLSIFDTQNDSLVMLKQLQKPAFKESELVIGPILQGGNKMLTAFAKEKQVYHVSPLMTFSKTKLNDPYWISSNPDLPSYANLLYDYFVAQHKDSANIIIISDKSSLDNNISQAFKQIMTPLPRTVKIRVVEYTSALDVNTLLSPTLPNHVVIPSAKENIVNRIIYSIKDTGSTAHVSCYGFQQWYDFKNTNYDMWERKNVHIVSPYFVNYQDEAVKRFIEAYRDRFATEPSDAAFKGYDQLLFFGMALQNNGKSFVSKIENIPFKMLHTTYRIRKQKEGFYQNGYINITRLVDGEAVKVN